MTSNEFPYRFTVGAFDCLVVQDGTFAYPYPAQLFFANAPEAERKQTLRAHAIDPDQWDEYVSPYPSVVIETNDQTILIDTGAGDLAPTTGNLQSNLRDGGFDAEDIDTVMLTHGHPDHIGGCVDDDGKPAFPNARYVLPDSEWEFWTSEPDLSDLGVDEEIKTLLREVPQKVLPAVEEQLDRIDADTETEIVPGVRALPAPGHSPGHMAVSVASEDDRLLHLVDTVLHPIHLEHPEWHAALDHDPDQLVETRKRLLEEAATESVPVLAYHFPARGLGHISRAVEAWEWQPIEGDLQEE
jgi:glyoxylase-like metal-dependent hydrolase (beta-lactamase superfamily II)